jgi:hypothetical protein
MQGLAMKALDLPKVSKIPWLLSVRGSSRIKKSLCVPKCEVSKCSDVQMCPRIITYDSEGAKSYMAGSYKFDVKDFEVFKVIF